MNVFEHRDWPYFELNVDKAWTLVDVHELNKVRIAFLDTGCNVKHKYLEGMNITCINSKSEPESGDEFGHGTFFTGILGQYINVNSETKPKIISIKMGVNGQISTEDICKGVKIAVKHGVDVLCIGACNLNYCPDIAKAVAEAEAKGIIIISPVGNNLKEEYTYPAALDTVCACASVDQNCKIAKHSNYNELLDVFAPGEELTGPMYANDKLKLEIDSDGLTKTSGTSFAAAITTSLAALVKSVDRKINNQIFKQILQNSSVRECKIENTVSSIHGWKVIDFYEAILGAKKVDIFKDAPKERHLYWNIIATADYNMRDEWKAEVYDSYGGMAKGINGKAEIELYKFSEKKESTPIEIGKGQIVNGILKWCFSYKETGEYFVRIIDNKGEIIKGLAFGNIRPESPRISISEKRECCIYANFEKDYIIYYSFDADRISVDSNRKPDKGTYIYTGVFLVPDGVDTVNAVMYKNHLFGKIAQKKI